MGGPKGVGGESGRVQPSSQPQVQPKVSKEVQKQQQELVVTARGKVGPTVFSSGALGAGRIPSISAAPAGTTAKTSYVASKTNKPTTGKVSYTKAVPDQQLAAEATSVAKKTMFRSKV